MILYTEIFLGGVTVLNFPMRMCELGSVAYVNKRVKLKTTETTEPKHSDWWTIVASQRHTRVPTQSAASSVKCLVNLFNLCQRVKVKYNI